MANSPGWKPMGPSSTQMRAPRIWLPMTGRQRQQQQHDADEQERVAVARQVAAAADDEQGGDVRADAERRPRRLQAGEAVGVAAGLVEPGDEDVADAVEQRGEREQERVGAAAPGGGWRGGR